jgi:hypothetical protein
VTNLTPEEKIILLLSRVSPSPEALEEAGRIFKEHRVDCPAMTKLAEMNGVTPLLYHNLKPLNIVPQDVMDRLKSASLRTVGENVRKAGEMIGIITRLREVGVEAIPLKGPVASDVIFGNPGLYPSSDLDILVRPSDLEGTKRALLEAGYREDRGTDEEDMLRGTYHLTFQNDRYVVEVHWTLAFRYFDIPSGFWWEDTGVMEYEGTEMRTLSAERYMLYTVFRLYRHAFRPLRFFVLIAEIIRKYRDEIVWEKLTSFAQTYRMERLLLFTLRLLKETLGAEVPEEILRRPVFGYRFLKRLVLSGLFSEVKRIHLRMLLYTFLQESPFDTAGVVLRRVFPLPSEIRLRYGLSAESRKVYLYYLLNPFLMVIRKR